MQSSVRGAPEASPIGRTTSVELCGLDFASGSMKSKIDAACRLRLPLDERATGAQSPSA